MGTQHIITWATRFTVLAGEESTRVRLTSKRDSQTAAETYTQFGWCRCVFVAFTVYPSSFLLSCTVSSLPTSTLRLRSSRLLRFRPR